jgi:sugar phosphate isomerase/epimerase
MAWEKGKDGWKVRVVPAGEGIVRWNEVAQAIQESGFRGGVSLHGEYEAKDLAERKSLARKELAFLRARLGDAGVR